MRMETNTRLTKVSLPPIKLITVDTEWGAKKLISQDDARNGKMKFMDESRTHIRKIQHHYQCLLRKSEQQDRRENMHLED